MKNKKIIILTLLMLKIFTDIVFANDDNLSFRVISENIGEIGINAQSSDFKVDSVIGDSVYVKPKKKIIKNEVISDSFESNSTAKDNQSKIQKVSESVLTIKKEISPEVIPIQINKVINSKIEIGEKDAKLTNTGVLTNKIESNTGFEINATGSIYSGNTIPEYKNYSGKIVVDDTNKSNSVVGILNSESEINKNILSNEVKNVEYQKANVTMNEPSTSTISIVKDSNMINQDNSIKSSTGFENTTGTSLILTEGMIDDIIRQQIILNDIFYSDSDVIEFVKLYKEKFGAIDFTPNVSDIKKVSSYLIDLKFIKNNYLGNLINIFEDIEMLKKSQSETKSIKMGNNSLDIVKNKGYELDNKLNLNWFASLTSSDDIWFNDGIKSLVVIFVIILFITLIFNYKKGLKNHLRLK